MHTNGINGAAIPHSNTSQVFKARQKGDPEIKHQIYKFNPVLSVCNNIILHRQILILRLNLQDTALRMHQKEQRPGV